MTRYRWLLLAFPRRVRRELGDEMSRLFEEQIRDARAHQRSVARVWWSAIADAAWHGPLERAASAVATARTVGRELTRGRQHMHAFRQDLRYAVRMLVGQPGVTVIALLTLALGIGANTAIFSAVDAVLLRPLPYPDPDRLVMVWEKRPTEGVLNNVVSPADYLDWARMNTVFDATAAMVGVTVDLTGDGEPVRLFGAAVSPPFFDVLGVHPALGRTFRPEESVVGQHRVVVIGHGLWQRRFGSDPAVIGRTMLMNGAPHEVVGVLPPTFEFPDDTIDVWAPLVLQAGSEPPSRVGHQLNVYARMKAGVTIEQARADMDRVAAQLSQAYPDANARHGAWVVPLREELTGPVRNSLLLLLGAVGFVLLIACVNVANLLLARASARRREMAVRAALGAGRGRLMGQALTESLLLGLCGGIAGLLVARWGIDLLRQMAPADLPLLGVDRIGLSPRVLTFSLVLSLATGLLFGLLPAWHFASQDLNGALKDGSRTQGGIRRRLRLVLVVSEIALASLLLVGAGLALRSFQTVLHTESGFRTEQILTALVSLSGTRYREEATRLATFDEIEQRFRSIPGVRSVGATMALPLGTVDGRRGIQVDGYVPPPDTPTRAHPRGVTPGYFQTLGIEVLSGRGFASTDRADAPLVVVVNETMAQRYWPGASPLGKRVRLIGTGGWREVVGVVRNVRHWGLERAVNPEMYMPLPQYAFGFLTFALATDGDPAAVTSAVREQLRAVDPNLPLSNIRTMDEVVARSVAPRRGGMVLLGIFGMLALVLAAAGIYGVMAHLVALRTSEIGLRMTLGAQPADVRRLVLREGLAQAIVGLAIGLGGAVILTSAFKALLFETSPADPLTFVSVAVILMTTALVACLVPASRAMRVDPVTALRN